MRPLARALAAPTLATLSLAAASPLAAQPNVAINDLQPGLGGIAVGMEMAAQTALDPVTYEVSLTVWLTNKQSVPLNLTQATLVFGLGFTPVAENLSSLWKVCGSGDLEAVAVNPVLPPAVQCKVMLYANPRVTPFLPEQISLSLYFEGWSPLVVQFPIVAYANSQPRGGFLFPGSTADLAPGQYWTGASSANLTSTHLDDWDRFAYDLGLTRWDEDSSTWLAFHPLGPGEMVNGDENEDWLVWGHPVRAMAEGEVVFCDDTQPDNPPGPVDPDAKANSFVIDHGDERVVYAHLMQGTANWAVCWKGATVKAGDFLGLVGNSGKSTQPHLHLELVRGSQGFPLNFRDVFLVDRTTYIDPPSNPDWSYADGQSLPWEKTAIWPSPLLPRASMPGLPADRTAVLDLSSGQRVVAGSEEFGDFALYLLGLDPNGDLNPVAAVYDSWVYEVAMALATDTDEFVVATDQSIGTLELTQWDDTLTEGPSIQGSDLHSLAIAPSPHPPGVVTAIETLSSELEVTAWNVAGGLGGITEGGTAAGGEAFEVSIATAPALGGVVTATRTTGGLLQLRSWSVSNNEGNVAPKSSVTDVAIEDVEIVYLGPAGSADRMLTVARDAAGNLLVTTWDVMASGIVRRHQASGGAVSEIAGADGGAEHALTAVRNAGGDLELIGWRIGQGGQIERHGAAPAGEATRISLGRAMPVPGTDRWQAVSAMVDAGGLIRFVSWEVALEP